MPAHGRWNADEQITAWPQHLTYDAIQRAEASDVRIVAFGDDLTHSSEDVEQSWPWLLEQSLNKRLGGSPRVAVINAGIPRTTSEQALIRLPRDVTPFAPRLVIFSFAFADSVIWPSPAGQELRYNMVPERAIEAMDRLWAKLSSLQTQLLYWTTNPMLPLDHSNDKGPKFVQWAHAQQTNKNQCLAHALHLCDRQSVPVFDLRSRFEVNGLKSARKWMADWYHHNTSGARNISRWFCEYIITSGLIG